MGRRGRPRLRADDPEIATVVERATRLKQQRPYVTWEAIGRQVGVSARTLRTYRQLLVRTQDWRRV